MRSQTVLLAVLVASLVVACGRRRGGPGGDDDDAVQSDGDADADVDCGEVVCGDGNGDLETYEGTVTGSWNDDALEGDVALDVFEGYAEVDLAVRASGTLVFTSHASFVEIDTFGNLLGDLEGEGIDGWVYVSMEGTVSDGVAVGTWSGEGASGTGSGAWSASLQ